MQSSVSKSSLLSSPVPVSERLLPIKTPYFSLCAIVTIPEQVRSGTALVVIPNSGLVHHVGTCRSSVNLARFLSAQGILVCRIDLPNLGDSGPRFDQRQMDEETRTREELGAVIDQLTSEFGDRGVIIYGLCSGSQNGFKLAVQDSRVIGLFGVDHFGFRNWSYKLVHYARQCFRLEPWLNQLKRLSQHKKNEDAQGNAIDLGGADFVWQYPTQKSVEAGYRVLVERGVRMQYVYTGDWSGEYNHRRQFFLMHSSVDFKGQVHVDYCPAMSHILAEPSSQEFIQSQVLAFVIALRNEER